MVLDINSPIGRRQLAMEQNQIHRPVLTVDEEKNVPPKQQTFNSPDPNFRELTSQEQNELKDLRAAKRKGYDLSDHSRAQVKFLTEICRATIEKTIDDTKFCLRSLKSKELKDMAFSLGQIEMNLPNSQVTLKLESRTQLLARSLYKINELPLELIIGTDAIEEKCAFIDELEEQLQSLLHEAYDKMSKDTAAKYQVKDKKEAEQLHEDIKK